MTAFSQVLILLLLVLNLNKMYIVGSESTSNSYDSFQVYLVNGSSTAEGRVEIILNGNRGTVCDVGWSLNNARVICRMLEFDGALAAPGNASFGQGSGNSYGNFDCVGTEDHLLDCPKQITPVGECDHVQDAGAICYSEAPFLVRLAGGANNEQGLVELMYKGSWGTICDHGWSLKDATVVCSMLGFHGALTAAGNASFGSGSGDIFLDDVTCDGTEDNLAECSHRGVGVHSCNHNEDAGVKCFFGDPFKVRLIGGSDDSEGRVEIFYDGFWGTVCDDKWDLKDAKVVCRMLGFDGALAAPGAAAYGQGYGAILLDDVGCDGTEDKIAACYHRGVGVHNCEHANDAGVRCFSGSEPFQVRLIGGEVDAEGRVEILYDGSWGTICDGDWDIRDATVVCRMLHFDGALEATRSARFGKGAGDSILNGVRCRGTEDHLADCLHGGFKSDACGHEKDASAKCYSNVRLVEGNSIAKGRVEIQHKGEWGTVCHDQWDILDATVVCRMLGFKGALKAVGDAYFGKGSGAIFLDEVQCKGTESRLTDCNHKGIGEHNCAHTEDASVVCDNEGDTIVGKVVGGVLGAITILLIIIGVASLVSYRRKKNGESDQEDPSPFAVSETTGSTKDLTSEGIQMTTPKLALPKLPQKLPDKALTSPIGLLKRIQRADETKTACHSQKADDGDGGDADEKGQHLYMSMGAEYDTPSAVKDDACVLSLNLGSDAPEDVPAAAHESVYMGDERVEAIESLDTEEEDGSVQDVKL